MLLIVQMIPGQALIIALFLDFKSLNLLGNLAGLVVVYSAQALPVTIWMLRNFVATIPKELEEAAAIDGASSVGSSGASCSRWSRPASSRRASSPSSPPTTSSSWR